MSSKAVETALKTLRTQKNAASKLTANADLGSRIMPNKSKDHLIPLRLDAGKYNAETKKLHVVLQVNSQAKGGLADWRNKNTSHAALATEDFDTSASDQQGELKRMFDSIEEKAKEALKK